MPIATSGFELVACHECDLLHRVPVVRDAHARRCVRCGATVRRGRMPALDHALSLAIAAFILLVFANTFPLLGFEIQGRIQETTIVNGALELRRQGYPDLGVLVLATSVGIPVVRLCAILALLLPMTFGRRPPAARFLLRVVQAIAMWGMTDVYLLGVIVAIVKLSSFATLTYGSALYAFVAYVVVSAWQQQSLDPQALWDRLWPVPATAVAPAR